MKMLFHLTLLIKISCKEHNYSSNDIVYMLFSVVVYTTESIRRGRSVHTLTHRLGFYKVIKTSLLVQMIATMWSLSNSSQPLIKMVSRNRGSGASQADKYNYGSVGHAIATSMFLIKIIDVKLWIPIVESELLQGPEICSTT